MEMPQQGAVGVEGSGGGAPLSSPPLSPASAAAAALANARWNPTKEQVAVLEGLYEHGLHTPSAEQIKQITARLRVHGHIEGKNVFYWFQNHKARQRQKQKQDSFAYFTRLLRRPPPPLMPVLVRPPGGPPYPNGRLPDPPAMAMMAPPPAAACNSDSIGAGKHVMYRAPFYFHPQHQMPVLYPRMDVSQDKMIPAAAQQQQLHYPGGTMYHAAAAPNNPSSAPPRVLLYPTTAAEAAGPSRETLQLFPLQPTFLLPDKQGRADAAGGASMASASSALYAGESERPGCPNLNGGMPPFYDFFGLQSGGR